MVSSFTFTVPPAASTPSAMKTIESVFATVQRKNASSHHA